MKSKSIFLMTLFLCFCGLSFGWMEGTAGSDKDRGNKTFAQPDWPEGIVELPRHDTRVYSTWFNGNESYHFNANPKQINELITLFSKARMRDHQVWIKPHKNPAIQFPGEEKIPYNVCLSFANGFGRQQTTQFQDPVITIYLDSDAALNSNLKIPDNIILHSEIDGFKIKGKTAKPKRSTFHAKIMFKGYPSAKEIADGILDPDANITKNFMRDLQGRITLWQMGETGFFKLSRIGLDGSFDVALSENELSEIKSGKKTLRVTIGNILCKPQKDDPVLPLKLLGEKGKTKSLMLNCPKFYYGRIIFEDGLPATLDPVIWPGTQIEVDFSYAGMPHIDKQGFFKVHFTDKQYKEMLGKKNRKNIYVPNLERRNSSSAKYVFPVSKLSKDKNNPGVVMIPRPLPVKAQGKTFEKDDNGNFILYVSNQSLDPNNVDIQVYVDKKKVIDQSFDVKGKRTVQHNWVKFQFKASSGPHTMQVKSKKGKAALNTTFKVTGKHWAVLDYWNFSHENSGGKPTQPEFSFNIENRPISFE